MPLAGPKDIESVAFRLHPSFNLKNPNVEVTSPPFAVSRTGWGEFFVEVLVLLFCDAICSHPRIVYYVGDLSLCFALYNVGALYTHSLYHMLKTSKLIVYILFMCLPKILCVCSDIRNILPLCGDICSHPSIAYVGDLALCFAFYNMGSSLHTLDHMRKTTKSVVCYVYMCLPKISHHVSKAALALHGKYVA